MQKNRKIRPYLCGVLTFFLSIAILILCVCAEIKMGFTTTSAMNKSIQSSGYAQNAQEEFTAKLEEIMTEHGMTMDMDSIVSDSGAYVEFSNYLKRVYKGKNPKKSADAFETYFTEVLDEYFTSNQIEMTDEMKTTVDEMVSQASGLYMRCVYPAFVTNIYAQGQQFTKTALPVCIVAAVFMIIIIILQFFMFHYKHRAINYVIIAVVTAAVWNVLLVIYAQTQLVPAKLGIGSEAYLTFVQEYLRAGYAQCYLFTAILICCAIIGILLSKKLKHGAK